MESTTTLIVALVGAAVSLTVGYLGHRRSKVVDAASAQSGAASNHRAGTQQVIEGLNLLIDQAQETIKEDREVIKSLDARIEKFTAELDACRIENARLRRKYGDNGDTPQPPNK